MRRGAAIVVAVLALAGCGDEERAQEPARATAAPTATATPAAPPAQAVRFRASDGKPVTAQYVPAGRNAPAVVLLHEIRGGPDQWDPLVPALHEAGFATLAYLSRSSPIEAERLPDALGAIRWLRARPDVDRRRIGMVGASIGASTTVFAMASGARATVDAAVALSPPDSSDIWALQDAGRYRPHDILFVSDERESTAVDGMIDGAVRSEALVSARPGHGVALLGEPQVHERLLAWLTERVR